MSLSSRSEEIIRSILEDEPYLQAPQSRIEELLLLLKGKIDDVSRKKMERVVLYLSKVGTDYVLKDADGNNMTFETVLPVIRTLSTYVVMLYGNTKLRPQYVSETEMQFTGVERTSSATKVHRVVLTPTRLSYDSVELQEKIGG